MSDTRSLWKMFEIVANEMVIAFQVKWIEMAFKILCVFIQWFVEL